MSALRNYRIKYFNEAPSHDMLEKVYDRVGGRLTFLNRVAKSKDMLKICDIICDMEKTWFLNKASLLCLALRGILTNHL